MHFDAQSIPLCLRVTRFRLTLVTPDHGPLANASRSSLLSMSIQKSASACQTRHTNTYALEGDIKPGSSDSRTGFPLSRFAGLAAWHWADYQLVSTRGWPW